MTVAVAGRWCLSAPEFETVPTPTSIIIEGGRIVDVQPVPSPPETLLMPALVNAHDHGYGICTLDVGAPDDALECWIPGLMLRPETDPELEAKVAFGRMARSGIGTTVHCHNSGRRDRIADEAAAVARAATAVGIRVAFSCPIADRNRQVYGDPASLPGLGYPEAWLDEGFGPGLTGVEQVENALEIRTLHQSPVFNVQLGPIGPQWVSEPTLERIAEASAQEGMRVHMHLLETERQRRWLDATYPDGPLNWLDDLGLLSPRLTVAHGVWLRPEEAELLAERGVTVAINSSSNLRLRSGIASAGVLDAAGVNLGLGLDGAGLDDDQDHFREMRLFKHLQSGMGLEDFMPATRVFRAATTDGYRVFDGSDDYGEMTENSRADIAVLDMERILDQSVSTPERATLHILAKAVAGDVRALYVAGREVVRDGKLVGMDFKAAERELLAQARRAGSAVVERSDLRKAVEAVRTYYGKPPY